MHEAFPNDAPRYTFTLTTPIRFVLSILLRIRRTMSTSNLGLGVPVPKMLRWYLASFDAPR